jgi:hypothetical protein
MKLFLEDLAKEVRIKCDRDEEDVNDINSEHCEEDEDEEGREVDYGG